MPLNSLAIALVERVAAGLRRKTLTSCSRWAESCRIMGPPFAGPWTFKYHPWLREMHDSEAEMNVGKKAAQVGYTETVLNRTFFMMDVKAIDCLYVLPSSTPDASDFSSGRFNPAIELSPHLSKIFSTTDNVGHKRAGTSNLYVRGSRARGQLKSIPTGFIVLDELDEMSQKNIPLAFERASGQMYKQIWAISTPTHPKFGISELYEDTTQERFFFKCPGCSRRTELVYPDCLEVCGDTVNDPRVTDSFLKCKECRVRLHHENKWEWLADGKWIETYAQRPKRGFHVSQLYSSAKACRPSEIATSVLKAQRGDRSEEQELFNSKFGLEHIVDGAGVTDAQIDAALAGYRNGEVYTGRNILTMGVDVGRWIHFEIDEWSLLSGVNTADINAHATPRVVFYGKVRDFEEIEDLIRKFGINSTVIDIHPERRKAYELACRLYGLIKMCMYVQGISGKNIQISPEEEHVIKVDRTSWLDLALGRFREPASIRLPMDTNNEYREHIKAPVRLYEKDQHGNPIARYRHDESSEDHYAHARTYAELALPFAISWANPSDIRE